MYLIEEQESLDHFLSDIKNEACIAVDTEFARVNTYYPKLCLVQIATPSLIACIDCLSDIDLSGLWEIIFDEKIEKIMVEAKHADKNIVKYFGKHLEEFRREMHYNKEIVFSDMLSQYNEAGGGGD